MLTRVGRQGRITLMSSLLSVEGSPMIQKILVLTCLTVMRRVEMLILTVRTTADYLQEMTAGMMMRSEYHDNLDTNLLFRISDSVSNATTTQKSSPVAVAGPTQSRKEMFAQAPAPVLLLLLVVGTLPAGRTSWQEGGAGAQQCQLP